jgi:phosphohistidine phosphatase
MLELLLLRHAKSRRDGSGDEGDHERDLAQRGLAAAAAMGRFMSGQGLIPDLALCSTATRTRRTWDLVADAIGSKVRTRFLRELYLAPPAQLLDIVRQQEGPRMLLLVGHNPGLHELAQKLAGGGEKALLKVLRQKLPTCGLVRLAFDKDAWGAVASGGGQLAGYWRPKDLDGPDTEG